MRLDKHRAVYAFHKYVGSPFVRRIPGGADWRRQGSSCLRPIVGSLEPGEAWQRRCVEEVVV